MATAPTSRRLNLTRDQLANFLSDQQQIRQFELLFAAVDELQVIVGTDFEYQADTAAANANNALAQISALAQDTAVDDAVLNAKVQQALDAIPGLAQALELIILAPRQEIGTIASQNSDNVNITGGLISGLDAPLPVASGGIGVTTAPANQVFAGPTAGAAAAPAFRALVVADIPALPYGTGTVTSVAALTLGTTGTDLSSTVANSTTTPVITLNVPTASATNRGALSAADWTTFNSKQPAGTYVNSVSGTSGRITSTGGTTPVIDLASGVATAGTTGSSTLIPVVTIDTYGRVTSITTAANPQGTVTSVTGTAPVVSSGGATPAISMAAANGSTNGYLTSTDWTTFNNKGSGTVTAVSVVSANGLAGTSSGGATPALTLSTSITGILKGNGTAISAAVVNTDYFAPSAPVTKTADFTVAATEIWLINNKSGSTCTATLPAAASWSGRILRFQNYQAQTLVSASSNVVPLSGGAAGTSILLASSGDSATLVSDGTNWLMTQYIPNNILLLE
jgi:hypothetical protein